MMGASIKEVTVFAMIFPLKTKRQNIKTKRLRSVALSSYNAYVKRLMLQRWLKVKRDQGFRPIIFTY